MEELFGECRSLPDNGKVPKGAGRICLMRKINQGISEADDNSINAYFLMSAHWSGKIREHGSCFMQIIQLF